MQTFSLPVAIAIIACNLTAAPAVAQVGDTIRVGSVRLARVPVRADTFDIDFEAQTSSGLQKRSNFSIRRTTMESRGRDSVLHMHFGSDRPVPYWDVYLDPTTLALVQFEQRTGVDSAIVQREGECFTGWVDLEKVARRVVDCDRFTDRFAGMPLEDHVVALVPLRDGLSAVLATYAVVGGKPDSHAFTVRGQDTLSIRGNTYRAWRVERRVTSQYGTLVMTTWVDRDRPRVLRVARDFGNGRRSVTTLRNP